MVIKFVLSKNEILEFHFTIVQ